MTFEPKKFDDIYNDMVQRTQELLPGMTDFKVGSVIRTMYESFAYEIALLYEQSNQVYLSAFIDTAEGTQLEMVVAILGIQRGLPDFAEGVVNFQRDMGKEAIEIPINTLVTTEDQEKLPKKVYKTIEPMLFPADQTTIAVKVQAVDRGEAQVAAAASITIMPQPLLGIKSVLNPEATQFRGKRAETDAELRQRAKNALLASGKASPTALETALLTLPGVKEVKVKERFRDNPPQHGVVDVFVNGIDFTDIAKVQYLNSQVDRVRAAGVMVRLQAAIPVMVDGVFQIEVDPAKVPTASDRLALEATVEAAIHKQLTELGMEAPLLFAQMQRQVLSIEGVTNLEEFVIAIERTDKTGKKTRDSVVPEKRRIDLNEAEKFYPHRLWVTSAKEIPLPVRIRFQASGIDRAKTQKIIANLKTYFAALTAGQAVSKRAIQAEIAKEVVISDNTLDLSVDSRSPLTIAIPEEIKVGLVERATLDENIFAYSQVLALIGAIRFTPIGKDSVREQSTMQTTIRDRVIAYLDRLHPEESIDLEVLEQIANRPGDQFTIDHLNPNDFRILLGEKEEIRLNKNKINVREFEKSQLQYFCIGSDWQSVTLDIKLILNLNVPSSILQTYNLSKAAQEAIIQGTAISTKLNAIPIGTQPPATSSPSPTVDLATNITAVKAKLQTAITRLFSTLPDKLTSGKDLSYETLQQTILTLATATEIQQSLAGITYRITQFDLTATSAADQRRQSRSLDHTSDIHLRSLEKITQITLSSITFTGS